eukprot:TRINITY_DN73924_c0_g1_i1.p1 TRINITY_DN73924_c0_g1~~TRINITY_DN73924_c0_g1_i1.p1  ORF type:complete len:897 (-),score=172.33 TRINITY_DN73924_c0_g1_i1:48-2696(-)
MASVPPNRSEPTAASVNDLLPLSVQIPRVETERSFLGQATSFVYVLEINAFGISSEVRHSFEDFEKLHALFTQFFRTLPSEVRKKLNYALPPLPSTVWYKVIDSPKTLDDRRSKLENLIHCLLQQSEVLNDVEGRLWQFLQLGPTTVAAIRLVLTKSRGPWIETIAEATAVKSFDEYPPCLLHPLIEETLLHLLADVRSSSVRETGLREGYEEQTEQPPSISELTQDEEHELVPCEIVARIYEAAKCADSVSASRRRTSGCQRISTLLPLAVRGHTVAMRFVSLNALLHLSQSDTRLWQEDLSIALECSENLAMLATLAEGTVGSSTAEGDPSPSCGKTPADNLVAELILRGFDGDVVTKFSQAGLADERKRLLNALFMSQDPFTRLAVGLLLMRLLLEPDYPEAVKAEAGLCSIYNELAECPSDFNCAKIAAIFDVEPLWTWICSLLSAQQAAVRAFVLCIILHSVQPSPERILETPLLLAALRDFSAESGERRIKDLAARTLLDAYRAEESAAPADAKDIEVLSSALAGTSESALAEHSIQHVDLGKRIASARVRWHVEAKAEFLVQATFDAAVRFHDKCNAWKGSMMLVDDAASEAEGAHEACKERLSNCEAARAKAISAAYEVASCSDRDLLEQLEVSRKELASAQAEVTTGTEVLESLVQEKMVAAREAAETGDEAKRWRATAAEAEEREAELAPHGIDDPELAPSFDKLRKAISAGEKAMAEPRAEECWEKHRESVEKLKAVNIRVGELDAQMRSTTAALSVKRQDAEACRLRVEELEMKVGVVRQRHASVLERWGDTFSSEGTCAVKLRSLGDLLAATHSALGEERPRRGEMRLAIHSLIQGLTALDGHLQMLEESDKDSLSDLARDSSLSQPES